jgi:large subunit ribosomal protein L29
MKQNADRARGLDAAEIGKELRDTAEQIFRLKFQMSMGQMEGVKKYQSLRKERARLLTVLRERNEARPSMSVSSVAPVAKAGKGRKAESEKPESRKRKKG